MVFLHGDHPGGAFELLADERGTDGIHIEAAGFLNGLLPEMDTHAGEVHRTAGHATLGLDAGDGEVNAGDFRGLHPGKEVFGELGVLRRLDGHEVGPAAEVADQSLGRQAAELIFRDGEGDDRAVLGGEAGVGELLEERHIGVAVERADDQALPPPANFLMEATMVW